MYYIGLAFAVVPFTLAHFELFAVEEPSVIKVMRLIVLSAGGLGMMIGGNRSEIDKLKQKVEYLERRLKSWRR